MTPSQQPSKHPASSTLSKDAEENKGIAALGYISVLCILPLILKKDSPFAQFHAKQGLVLFIAEVITWLAAPIFIATFVLAWVPVVLYIAYIIASLYGMYSAWNGQQNKLPGVDWIIKKFNF